MTLDLNDTLKEMYKNKPQKLSKRPKVEEAIATSYEPKLTFDQLHGCDSIRNEILKITNCFKRSIKNQAVKSKCPILLYGSSGLGKTSIVEAAAKEANLKFIALSLEEMVSKTRSDFNSTLEQFSAQCFDNHPAIVLIDDLNELDDDKDRIYLTKSMIKRFLQSDRHLLIFCTTSSILDKHWTLRLYFRIIQLKRPDLEARFAIVKSLLKEKYSNLKSLTEENLKMIALNTPSFTPADLNLMLNFAQEELDDGENASIQHCEAAINFIKDSFGQSTHLIAEKPQTTWTDIGGMSEVRKAFIDILRELKTGELDCRFACIALYGPPGCGKTMVAKAMANEAGFNFISINPGNLQDKFYGETEKNIQRVFREAREYEPCVIFFDEFDGLCKSRGSKDNMTNAIQTLLSEMDGFINRGKSIVLVSTNRLEDIDYAMKRPGRLSKHIYVGYPDESARKEILDVLIKQKKLTLSNDISLDSWAKKTENFSGADLAFFISEAKIAINCNEDTRNLVTQEHLEFTLKKIRDNNKGIGVPKKNLRKKVRLT